MRSLIDLAVERGAYIDQSQSLYLFMENPEIGRLSSMYLYAWKQGLKTPTTCARAPPRRSPRPPCAPARPPPSPRPLPAPWKTRKAARPANECRCLPAGCRVRSHAAPDALSTVLRDVSRCHQEHLDGPRRSTSRSIWGTCAAHDAGGTTSHRAAGGVLCHRRLYRFQQPRDQSVPPHQFS